MQELAKRELVMEQFMPFFTLVLKGKEANHTFQVQHVAPFPLSLLLQRHLHSRCMPNQRQLLLTARLRTPYLQCIFSRVVIKGPKLRVKQVLARVHENIRQNSPLHS